jgi:hypothetical protein
VDWRGDGVGWSSCGSGISESVRRVGRTQELMGCSPHALCTLHEAGKEHSLARIVESVARALLTTTEDEMMIQLMLSTRKAFSFFFAFSVCFNYILLLDF